MINSRTQEQASVKLPGALRFIDLLVGGFHTRDLELKLELSTIREPVEWFVFAAEDGQWVELADAVEVTSEPTPSGARAVWFKIPLERLGIGVGKGERRLLHLAIAAVPAQANHDRDL